MFKRAPDQPHSAAPSRDLEVLIALHAEARHRAVQLRREAMDAAWRATGQALRRSAVALLRGVRRFCGAAANRCLLTRDSTRIQPRDPMRDLARNPTHCPRHHTS